MEKMMIVIYNKALEKEILNAVDLCEITCYTKIPKVYGRGESGGPRMGSHVWPGENEMLMVVTEEERVQSMIGYARKLKKKHEGKGVKVFVLPAEEKV